MRTPISLLAVIGLVLAACGQPGVVGDAGPLGPVSTTAPSTTAPSPTTTQPPSGPTTTQPSDGTTTTTAPGAESTTFSVYFMMDAEGETNRPGPFLVPVHREVPHTEGVARAALTELLVGPSEEELEAGMSSAIPDGTVLLGVRIENGLATVDLSREYESGGGTFSMTARLTQVVHTVTQFRTVDRVTFHLDGEPVEVFSGEGLVLDEPVMRDDYLDLLPQIFVDQPAWGAPVSSPLRVVGKAAVFEATFHLALYDGDGEVLAEPPFAMTDEGMGWGEFDVTLEFSIDEAQMGSLTVWDFSAEDGDRQNVREYALRLLP